MDKQISKDKSKGIKFIAVIIMVILHVFGFPDRIAPYSYKSFLTFGGGTIESYLATGSSIVVHLFLFVSGYGMYLLGEQNYKQIFKRIKNLYLEYWSIFFIFIPLGYYLGKYKFNVKEFLYNFVGIISSYNAEWWFLRAYIIYMLIYPLTRKVVKKYPKISLIGAMFITGSGMILGKLIRMTLIPNNLFFSILASTLEYYYPFVCGMVVVEKGYFDNFKYFLERKNINFKFLFIVTVIFICWIEKFNYIRHAFNFGLVPLFICLLSMFKLEKNKFILMMSKYTTGIWLIHSFFCYYYFKGLAFFPKYSLLILIWIILLSTLCTVGINYIKNKILKI